MLLREHWEGFSGFSCLQVCLRMEWGREKAFVLEVDLFLLISLHGDYPLKGK